MGGVGGLVEELEEKPTELRLYSDSSAAPAIVNGSSGSWRTRHLRIRAAAPSEAVKLGDVQLQHVPGQSLVADGFTKQLGASPFGRFKESLGFYGGAVESGESPVEVVKVKKIEISRDRRLEKVLGLLVVASTCVELTEAKEMDLGEEGGGYWWLVVIVAVVILLKLVKEFGVVALRNCLRKEEELRFQRTCAEAVMPERPTESSAGVNLFAVNRVVVPAESYTLVRTGVKAQLPRGTCGRITTVASLALRGVETGSAVIERDFSGEVRILVRNHGPQDYVIEPEEAVAQLVLEKVSLAKIKEVKELDGPVKKQKEEVGPSVRSLVVEKAGASSGRSSMNWMKPEVKGFENVGEGLRLRKVAPAGGGDGPPEVTERPSQDEPGEDEWEVEFRENEIRLSRIHMVRATGTTFRGLESFHPASTLRLALHQDLQDRSGR